MSRHWSRRGFLQNFSVVGFAALSGCSNLPFSSSSELDIRIANFDEEEYLLDVRVIKPNGSDLSSTTVLRESFYLHEAGGPGNPFRPSESIAVTNQQYIVRTAIAGMDETQAHYHYYPDCKSEERGTDRLYIDIRTGGDRTVPDIEFGQNLCG